MPAAIFLSMNKPLQNIFAHPTPGIWHRVDGPVDGDQLKLWFNTTSSEITADGFMVNSGHPTATIFVADILALDPTRAGDENELVHTDEDTLTVDGKLYRISGCLADGYGKVTLDLRSAP